MKKQAGFTLIELIIVIVILGILAAYAVPKYMNLDKQARVAAVNGLAGSIRAAADIVHASAVALGTASGTVDMGGGTTITVANYYPSNKNEAIKTIQDSSGFTTGTSTSWTKIGAPTAESCGVTYTAPTSAGYAPIISISSTGC